MNPMVGRNSIDPSKTFIFWSEMTRKQLRRESHIDRTVFFKSHRVKVRQVIGNHRLTGHGGIHPGSRYVESTWHPTLDPPGSRPGNRRPPH
jgi:hypothetical protein